MKRQAFFILCILLFCLCMGCGKISPSGQSDTFVEEEGWHRAARRYEEFLEKHKSSNVLLLELGCGMNTPGIIKFPFWKLAARYEQYSYACVNMGEAWAPEEISSRSLCLDADIAEVLQDVRGKEE